MTRRKVRIDGALAVLRRHPGAGIGLRGLSRSRVVGAQEIVRSLTRCRERYGNAVVVPALARMVRSLSRKGR